MKAIHVSKDYTKSECFLLKMISSTLLYAEEFLKSWPTY